MNFRRLDPAFFLLATAGFAMAATSTVPRIPLKDFFDNQTWILSRVQDAERTRTVIAHTNLLSSEEGERLEMYLRDLMRQIS